MLDNFINPAGMGLFVAPFSTDPWMMSGSWNVATPRWSHQHLDVVIDAHEEALRLRFGRHEPHLPHGGSSLSGISVRTGILRSCA